MTKVSFSVYHKKKNFFPPSTLSMASPCCLCSWVYMRTWNNVWYLFLLLHHRHIPPPLASSCVCVWEMSLCGGRKSIKDIWNVMHVDISFVAFILFYVWTWCCSLLGIQICLLIRMYKIYSSDIHRERLMVFGNSELIFFVVLEVILNL